MQCKYALDEADEKGWFPLHEAVVQPIQQILETVLDGKNTGQLLFKAREEMCTSWEFQRNLTSKDKIAEQKTSTICGIRNSVFVSIHLRMWYRTVER